MWAQNDAMQIPGRDWVGARGGYGPPMSPPMQAMPMPAQAPPMAPPMQAMPSTPTQSWPMPQPNIGEIIGRLFGKPIQNAPGFRSLGPNDMMTTHEFRPWDPSRKEFDPNYKMPDFKMGIFPGQIDGESKLAGDEYRNKQIQSDMIEELKKKYNEQPPQKWVDAGSGPTGMQVGRGQEPSPIDPRFLQMIQGMMQPKPMPYQAPPRGNILGGWRQQMNRSDIGSPNEGMGSPLFAQIMALKAAQGGR